MMVVTGEKTAYTECLEIVQLWDEAAVNGLDYKIDVIRKHPEWVREAHDLGLKVNVWTVNTEDVMREMIDLGVDYITTDEPVLLQQVLSQKRR